MGTAHFRADPNATTLKEIWDLPATQKLREQTLQQLARAPYTLLRPRLNLPPADGAALLRPLWDDLLSSESLIEIRARPPAATEWTLAVQLSEPRAQVWSANLRQLLELWKAAKTTPNKEGPAADWDAVFDAGPWHLHFTRIGPWIVLGMGPEPLEHSNEWVSAVRRQGRPPIGEAASGLNAHMDLARIVAAGLPRQLLGWLPEPLPVIDLAMTVRTNNVKTQAHLQFSEPPVPALEPWRIPLHTMREPLVSFTAVQGLAPYLKRWDWLKPMELEQPPNQLFLWAQAQVPFQTYLAVPLPNVTNLLLRWGRTLPALVAAQFAPNKVGQIQSLTNQTEIVWAGLPVIVPFLCPAPEPGGGFLLAGLFPAPWSTNPPPPELIAQVAGKTNLLYYDWEYSQERLGQVRILSQLYKLFSPPSMADLDAANTHTNGNFWLATLTSPGGEAVKGSRRGPAPAGAAPVIGRHLGNVVTEITLESPRRWGLQRTSQLGLSSVELVALCHWLDDPRFPLFGYTLPARPKQAAGNPSRKP